MQLRNPHAALNLHFQEGRSGSGRPTCRLPASTLAQRRSLRVSRAVQAKGKCKYILVLSTIQSFSLPLNWRCGAEFKPGRGGAAGCGMVPSSVCLRHRSSRRARSVRCELRCSAGPIYVADALASTMVGQHEGRLVFRENKVSSSHGCQGHLKKMIRNQYGDVPGHM